MASFTASPIVSAGGDPGVYDASQHNSLLNTGLQQDLTDRQTFRDNAAGLVARDPTATGQAMGANPQAAQAFLSSIPNMDANTREQATSDMAASGSLAGAVLNAPPEQRQSAWDAGRQTLIASGHKMVPPAVYPGDDALHAMRGIALTAQQQFEMQPQIPTVNPQPILGSTPGGGYVGPGGTQGQAPVAGGGITATPLLPPGQSDPNAPAGPSSSYAKNMIGAESGGDPNAQNPMSSAGGAGQFIDSTWLGLLPQVRPDLAKGRTPQQQLALKSDPTVSTQMVQGYAQQNAPKLSAAGVPVNDTTLALAHRFGPDTAIQVASASPNTPIANIVGPQVMAVNPDLRGKTVGLVQQFYAQRVGGGAPARTQVASAANSTGMQPTATDASPGAAPAANPTAPISHADERFPPPASAAPPNATNEFPGVPVAPALPPGQGYAPTPTPDSPHDTPSASAVVSVDNPASAAGLPTGTVMQMPGRPMQAKPAPVAQAPAPTGTASMSPSQAVQQATAEYGASLASMDPAAANALVQQRAQQLLNGGKGTAPSPSAGPSPNQLLGAGAPTAPSQSQPNALASLGPVGAAPAPRQNALSAVPGTQPVAPNAPNSLLQPMPGSSGAPSVQQQPNSLAPAPASQQTQPATLPFLRNPRTGAMVPVAEQPGYYLAQAPNGSQVAQRMPGAPGAGTETTAIGGTAYVKDKQTGQVVSTYQVPNTMRATSVQGPNGTVIMQGGQQVGVIPFSTQPAQVEAWKADQSRATQVAQQATDAEQGVQQALEGRSLAQGLPTGAGGEARADIANWLKTYAPGSVYDAFVKSGYVPDAPQAQEAAKVFLRQAASDEKQMGGSGGLGLTEKYAKANPSLNMQPEAIQGMSDLKAVTAQAAKDYSDGFLQYFNQQQDGLLHNGQPYAPASNFDQQWHNQKNAQNYFAAINAMRGQPYAEWSKGLQPQDQDYALGVISRIDPTATVQGPRGSIGVVKGGSNQGQASAAPPGGAPPVGTVMQGYRFTGGNPSSPASWARAQ